MRHFKWNAPGLIALLVLSATNSSARALQDPAPSVENPLQIISAGVETSEDAPFAPAGFRFLPGDYVYCQFQISGYSVQKKQDGEVRQVSLTYDIVPLDSKGVPLAAAVGGSIHEELGGEDKNWTPKRRASFLLPSFVAAGDFHVHIEVKDIFGHSSAERDLAFHMGGAAVAPAGQLSVQDFQFTRKEDDPDPLEVAAYAAGDTVYAHFLMTGFRLNPGNEYELSYGLTVKRPSGTPYVDEPSAAHISNRSFYPAAYVPGTVSVMLARGAPKGQYVLILTVHDKKDGSTYEIKRAFSVE